MQDETKLQSTDLSIACPYDPRWSTWRVSFLVRFVEPHCWGQKKHRPPQSIIKTFVQWVCIKCEWLLILMLVTGKHRHSLPWFRNYSQTQKTIQTQVHTTT
jgi:hypothetical protein